MIAYGSADPEEGDPDHDGEGRAARDPQDAGVGQRIARDGLHRGARHRQRGADEDREDRARDARDDGRLRDAVQLAAERRQDVSDAHLADAERDRRDAQQEEDEDSAGEPRQTHRRRAPQRGGVRQRCAGLSGAQASQPSALASSAKYSSMPQPIDSGEGLAEAASGVELSRMAIVAVRDGRDLREQRVCLQLLDDRAVCFAVRHEDVDVREPIGLFCADREVELLGRLPTPPPRPPEAAVRGSQGSPDACRGWCRSRSG